VNIKDSFLPKFSVHRPITVLMTFMAILVVGFIAYTQIPVELMPDVIFLLRFPEFERVLVLYLQ